VILGMMKYKSQFENLFRDFGCKLGLLLID